MNRPNENSRSTPELHELLISLSKDLGSLFPVIRIDNPRTGRISHEHFWIPEQAIYNVWIDSETGNIRWNREDFSYREKIQ